MIKITINIHQENPNHPSNRNEPQKGKFFEKWAEKFREFIENEELPVK